MRKETINFLKHDNKLIVKNLSPLRYPGSKKNLVVYLYRIIKHNKLSPNVFIEPFAGGGNVALNFITNKIVKKIIIADKDKLLYSFWYTVFAEADYLINFIRRTRVDLKTFLKYKKIAQNAEDYDRRELARACLFLNRTSFSGILTNIAGPLGGVKQKSKYKINCRFNKEVLIKKIRYISSFKKKVIVLPYDWSDTVNYAKKWIKYRKLLNKPFFYFDPPFFRKAKDLYRCYFDSAKHIEFCNELLSLEYDWVLSYDNVSEIKEMYSNNSYIQMHMEMPYSINSHAKRIEKELIITPLDLPKLDK